jgi:hypothetical protein
MTGRSGKGKPRQ